MTSNFWSRECLELDDVIRPLWYKCTVIDQVAALSIMASLNREKEGTLQTLFEYHQKVSFNFVRLENFARATTFSDANFFGECYVDKRNLVSINSFAFWGRVLPSAEYSMWSLVRVFSENDKIFRQEKQIRWILKDIGIYWLAFFHMTKFQPSCWKSGTLRIYVYNTLYIFDCNKFVDYCWYHFCNVLLGPVDCGWLYEEPNKYV